MSEPQLPLGDEMTDQVALHVLTSMADAFQRYGMKRTATALTAGALALARQCSDTAELRRGGHH